MALAGRGNERAFFTHYGISRTGDPQVPIAIEPYPQLCHSGCLRSTVLAAAVDIVASLFTREIAGSDAIFTTDLSVRAPARPAPRRILARGELLRSGRSVVATEVRFEADGVPFAYGQASFRRVEREGPPPTAEELAQLVLPEVIDRVPLQQSLELEAGVVVTDASRGRVELPLRDALRTPGGVVQGALVALMVEQAALARAEHADAGPHVVTELDVRYLTPGREGPITSSAQWVTDRDSGMLQVALRDAGRGDRICTAALARVSSRLRAPRK